MKVQLTEILTITTEHPASSYGRPVVVDNEGKVYGPEDCFPQSIYSWNVTFREVMEGQLLSGAKSLLTQEQILGIEQFLGR